MRTVSSPSERLIRLQSRWQTATCTISRSAGEPVRNEETGQLEPPPPTTVYAGQCLVTPEGGDRVQEFGEGPVVTRTAVVSIDDITVDVRVGDTVTVTASRDPLMVDRSMTVLDVPRSELVTVRRLTVEEVLD